MVANNPLVFIDPDGRSLYLVVGEGQEEAINTFIQIVNERLGDIVSIDVDENGKVFFQGEIDQYALNVSASSEAVAMFDVLNDAMDEDQGDVVLNLVQSDPNYTPVDPYEAIVDVDDVEKYNGSNTATAAGVMGHEIAEQTSMQRSGKRPDQSYVPAHKGPGVDAEDAINGSTRIDIMGINRETSDISQDAKNGHIDLRYIKNGKLVIVRTHLKNGNFTKVEDIEIE
ncbi:MAG: hypothetical protein AAF587_40595 [Bacteroidota bacterium]